MTSAAKGVNSVTLASVAVSCPACHRTASLNVDRYSEHIAVPAFGPRMVCTGCGFIGADAGGRLSKYVGDLDRRLPKHDP